MSYTYISVALRQLITERANGRCEYCLIHQDNVLIMHQPDHIIAEQHGGKTEDENMALACIDCNRYKGSNIASIDPVSQTLTPLFNPRRQIWIEHFKLDAGYIHGLTAVGRVTIKILQLNSYQRVQIRQSLHETN